MVFRAEGPPFTASQGNENADDYNLRNGEDDAGIDRNDPLPSWIPMTKESTDAPVQALSLWRSWGINAYYRQECMHQDSTYEQKIYEYTPGMISPMSSLDGLERTGVKGFRGT